MEVKFEKSPSYVQLAYLIGGQVFRLYDGFSTMSRHSQYYMVVAQSPLLPNIENEGTVCFAININTGILEKFNELQLVTTSQTHIVIEGD